VNGAGQGRSLILNCHLDVVGEGDPTEWSAPPYSGAIDPAKEIIFGRGAMDDKAGAAIILGLLRVITDCKLRFAGDLIIHFVLDDEITGNGSLACLEAGYTADAAMIVDGTRLDRAIDQQAGSLEFHIRFKGRPVSASVSHMGLNAAEVMARVLLKLRDDIFARNAIRQPPWTQFPSPYQFVIHAMDSDSKRFTVPDKATARCYVTFPPPDKLAQMKQYLKECCVRIAGEMALDCEPEIEWNGFTAEPASSATDELREALQQAACQAGLPALQFGPSTGISDLRHFANRGIPCMLYGPGRGFNPHRPDEHYYLADLSTMMKLYLNVISRWCGCCVGTPRAP
jgi:acetylornithine deacetylase